MDLTKQVIVVELFVVNMPGNDKQIVVIRLFVANRLGNDKQIVVVELFVVNRPRNDNRSSLLDYLSQIALETTNSHRIKAGNIRLLSNKSCAKKLSESTFQASKCA